MFIFTTLISETDISDERQLTEGFINIINNKFWEELIVYFPLIRHESYRKRHIQQLFVAARTSLPSFCLLTIGEYIDSTQFSSSAPNLLSLQAGVSKLDSSLNGLS
jgi:hypothetical protein